MDRSRTLPPPAPPAPEAEAPPAPPAVAGRLSRRGFLAGVGGAAVLASGATGWALFGRPSAAGPRAEDFDAGVVTAWTATTLAMIEAAGYPPPVAARTLGHVAIGLYESVVGGLGGAPSLATVLPGELRRLPAAPAGVEHHWPTVANAAMGQLLPGLFPKLPVSAQRRMAATYREFAVPRSPRAVLDRSVAHGRAVGDAVLAWALTVSGRASDQRRPDPAPEAMTGRGAWEPTPPEFAPALLPSWGSQRPLVIRAADGVDAPPPPRYSEDPGSPFHREAVEVYETGRALTDEQRAIARFWADGAGTTTPAGHWAGLLNQVLDDRRSDLGTAASAHLRLGLAVTDAFVACWHTKYRYLVLRPITYVQRVLDPSWTPLVVTPPFPEYTSGHSVQSAAAARVLTGLLGDTAITDRTHEERGLGTRSFPSFAAAADEAAISRLYGGIHYRSAIERGLEQGRAIGDAVLALDLDGAR